MRNKNINYIQKLVTQHWMLVLLIVFSGVIASLLEGITLGLVIPILGSDTSSGGGQFPFPFDRISAFFEGMDIFSRMRLVALFLVVVSVIKGFCLYLNNVFSCVLQVRVIKYFRMKIFDQIMRVSMGYINKQKNPNFINWN